MRACQVSCFPRDAVSVLVVNYRDVRRRMVRKDRRLAAVLIRARYPPWPAPRCRSLLRGGGCPRVRGPLTGLVGIQAEVRRVQAQILAEGGRDDPRDGAPSSDG